MCDHCKTTNGFPRYDLPGVPDLCEHCYFEACDRLDAGLSIEPPTRADDCRDNDLTVSGD